MTKIKDFLKTKLINFKKFIQQQFDDISMRNLILEKPIVINNYNKLLKELDFFSEIIDSFISSLCVLNIDDVDQSIKIFLLNYEINIDDIKDYIDYGKLKRYIEMFFDVIKK